MGIAKFVKKTFAMALLTCVCGIATAHEIGLQVFTFRHQFEADGVDKTFATISDMGIDAIEAGGNMYGLTIYEYKQLLAKHNLQVVSVDTNYDEVANNPMAIVYKAEYFGAKYATFYWIPHEGDFGFEHAKAAVEAMNKAGALLKQHGITLQYHPHGYELKPHGNATLLDYIIENVTEAQFQMDVFWIVMGGGDPVQFLKKYPGRFTSFHMKDRKKGSPNTDDGSADKETNVTLGTGDAKIAEVVKEAKKQGVEYFFIEDESSRIMEQVPASIKFLQSHGLYL